MKWFILGFQDDISAISMYIPCMVYLQIDLPNKNATVQWTVKYTRLLIWIRQMGSLNRPQAQRLKLGQFSKNWPQLADKCQHLYGSLGRCYILIIVYTLFVFHFFSWYFIEETIVSCTGVDITWSLTFSLAVARDLVGILDIQKADSGPQWRREAGRCFGL